MKTNKPSSTKAVRLRGLGDKHGLGPMMTELYRKAEVHLRKQKRQHGAKAGKAKASPPVLETDSQRQFHELQVHQVELEMQNVELLKVREELEATLEQFTDLYDFAPVGYFTLAADSTIQQANLAGASLVGVERSRLVGRCFDQLFAVGQRPAFRAFLQRVFAGQANLSGDFELSHSGQPLRDINIKAQRSLYGDSCRVAVMDITEHKRAEDKVRVSEIRYRRLFETAHDGVLLLDPATRKITDANPFMTQLLGYSHDRLVGKEMFQIGLLKDENASKEMFQELKRNHQVRYEDLPLKSKTGKHQEVEVVANLYQENGRAVIQCNIRDITARKLVEDALRESEERFRAMANALPQLAWIARPDGHIFWYNQRWYDYTGTTLKQMEGWGWQSVHDTVELSKVMARWKSSLATGKPFDMTFPLRGADGHFRSFLTRVLPLKNADHQVVQWFGTNTDVEDIKRAEATQRRAEVLAASNKKLELEIVRRQAVEKSLTKSEQHQIVLLEQSRVLQDQLRRLSHQVLHAQEEERKRISRELHDVIAQTLTGINIRLAALKKEAALNREGFDHSITRTQKLVEHSVNVVHEFARELRPAVLDDLGLIPALHSFVKIFSQRTHLHVDLKAFAGVEQLDNNKRTILYRVAQEALNNVARHAQASRVEVSIQKLADGGIGMKIKDDGKSFRVERALPANGCKRLGLVGMRERVEMVGGKFAVASTPGQGTTIIAQIPLLNGKRV